MNITAKARISYYGTDIATTNCSISKIGVGVFRILLMHPGSVFAFARQPGRQINIVTISEKVRDIVVFNTANMAYPGADIDIAVVSP